MENLREKRRRIDNGLHDLLVLCATDDADYLRNIIIAYECLGDRIGQFDDFVDITFDDE